MQKCDECGDWFMELIEIPFNGKTLHVCGYDCFARIAHEYYQRIIKPQPHVTEFRRKKQ